MAVATAVMTDSALAATIEAATTEVATTEATSAAMMTVLVMIAPTSVLATSVLATVRTDVTMSAQDMAGTTNAAVTTAVTAMKTMAANGPLDAMTVTARAHVVVPAAMTVRDMIAKVIVTVAALVNLLPKVLADIPIPLRAPSHENNTEV